MNTKTITLTGAETTVRFDRNYPYFWVRNPGDSDVYMSVKPGIAPDADGVVTVPAGGGACSGNVSQVDTLYFLGSGKVEVSPQDHAVCPFFKAGGKGGDVEPSGGLSVGGRNYVRNGNFADGLNGWGTNGYGNVTLYPELDYEGHEHNLLKIDLAGKDRSTSIYQDIYLPVSGLKNQRTAVISFYARRGNNDDKVSGLGIHFNEGNSVSFDVPYADNYKSNRYSFSLTTDEIGGNEYKGGRTRLWITLYGDDSGKNGIIYISDIQIEFADNDVVSDYRPAPEDLRYTLPAATADTLGGVKVDGTTIVINDGVISIAPGLLGG